MSTFLKLLPRGATDKRTFQNLCEVLQAKYEWIADELSAELMAETGDLVIEDHILNEAGIRVFQKFGQVKRLSAKEKLDIRHLVALRTQYAKSVCSRKLAEAEKYLEEVELANKEKDAFAKMLSDKITGYLEAQRGRLRNTPAYESEQSTTAMFRERERMVKKGKHTPAEALEDSVKDLTLLSEECRDELNELQGQRSKAFNVLSFDEVEDPDASLNDELKRTLARAQKELKEKQDQLQQRAEQRQRLQNKYDAMHSQNEAAMSAIDVDIEKKEGELRAIRDKTRDVEDEMEHLNKELGFLQEQIEKHQTTSKGMEKTRHLGYVEKEEKKKPAIKKTPLVTIQKEQTKKPAIEKTQPVTIQKEEKEKPAIKKTQPVTIQKGARSRKILIKGK